jgi:regulation of enolase protein 1 (concanavalin A-like superfamily)
MHEPVDFTGYSTTRARPWTIAFLAAAILPGFSPLIAAEFTGANIGPVSLPGSVIVETNGWRVSGAGRDIGGSEDQCHFAWREETGDFDFAVRIAGMDPTDVWAKAGLMVRESLDPGGAFAAVFASPTLSGCFMQSRAMSGGASAAPTGGFPINFPETWLRLKRQADRITAYAGLNSENWEALGSVSLNSTNASYFGLAVTSHNTNAVCTAEFRDLRTASDEGAADWPCPIESPGPSSRRTGLALTEIMYRPPLEFQSQASQFVEIFNSNPFYEDISGYRLAGSIEYTFPAGTIIPGGGFLVIAAAPAQVESAYNMRGVLGPFSGVLSSEGHVQLLDAIGGVLLEVRYANQPPWPVEADGLGHSLVLARPSYGERSASAWSASGFKGGSPGRFDGRPNSRLYRARINEVRLGSATPADDFVELYNHSRLPVDLSGAWLGSSDSTTRWQIPLGTILPPAGFIHFPAARAGLSAARPGVAIVLERPDRLGVTDSLWLSDQARLGSVGRYPDGAPTVALLADASPALANHAPLPSPVVINEILYHPISGDARDEYVELHNPTGAGAAIGGWAFTEGISFTFPPGRTIPAGGYLVLARDAARLLGTRPDLDPGSVLGNFDGKLSDSGERLTLSRPVSAGNTSVLVPVESVSYGTGGRWGQWADGGGGSLERRNPRAAADSPSSWADSANTKSADWTTIETTAVLDNGGVPPNALHILLLGAGECLVDDVELIPEGSATNLVSNPSFESGLKGWTAIGNHVRSTLETTDGFHSGQSLHLRASGRGDTGPNQVRIPLNNYSALSIGGTATLRAKVKWLKGFPEMALRLRGNWLEATGRLRVPSSLGSPGQQNSAFTPNPGPAIDNVTHSPALPPAGNPVRVFANILNSDGPTTVSLHYRVDPATNTTSLPMVDDGTNGDAVAGDGIFTATIPPPEGNALVAFHISANNNTGAEARFPATAPARECLVRFGEAVPASSFATYRLWLTAATVSTWKSRPVLSNEELDATFVYGNQRVIYNVGGRYSGSPWHQIYSSPIGSPCTYALSMPGDNPVLGTTSFNKIHVPGNTPADDNTIQCEQTAYWIVRQTGLPANYQRYVQMFVNGIRRGQLMEDTQVPSGDALEERFPGDSDGPLYKLNGWYEFEPGTGPTLQHYLQSWCTLNNFTTTGGAKKLARYRWNWSPRSEGRTANDYGELFNLIDAANTPKGGPFAENLRAQANIDQWLRTFAVEHAVGNWDSFGNRNAQNMYAYKPARDRWHLLIWDFNIVLGNSNSDGPSGDDLFQYNAADRAMGRIYQEPEFVRAYLRTLKEIAAGPMAGPEVARRLDARFAAFKAGGITVSLPNPIKTWIASRRTYLLNSVKRYDAPFTVAGDWSAEQTTNRNSVTLSGTAPLDVAAISVNGNSYPLSWTTPTNWTMIIPLHTGPNSLALQALDRAGSTLTGMAATVSVRFIGSEPNPVENLAINEILAHPARPGAEFVELVNHSADSVFDLGGWRFQGLDYDFPPGALILPGEYVVLTKDRAAFGATYGYARRVAGEFPGNLSEAGETLRLVSPGAAQTGPIVVDEVSFSNRPPWPAGTSEPGVSLQLGDSKSDNRLAENWIVITPAQVSTPAWRFVSVTGAAADSRLLLYHSPYEAPRDPMDLEGSWAGTIDFPGLAYNMAVEFTRIQSNRWSGSFSGDDYSGPLGNIRFTPASVSFSLAGASGVVWNGKMSSNGLSITGNFSQSGPQGSVTYPFQLKRNQTTRYSGGEVYLDDLQLVAGTIPGAGRNLVLNGDFESQLAGTWNIATNHAQTELSASFKRAGNTGLRLVAGFGGKDAATAVWQDVPSVVPGATYTLSYWYLPSTNGNDLTVRLGDGPLTSSHTIHPDAIATPGQPNSRPSLAPTNAPAPPAVFINEWLAVNTRTLQDPADGQFEDWIELYNAEPEPVDLSGFTLTDTAANKSKWRIPDGTVIPARGFLLVWADEEGGQKGLHANFKLSQTGEAIGLFAPNGALVDWVEFGQQAADISEGRASDGAAGAWARFTESTPGANNAPAPSAPIVLSPPHLNLDGTISLTWAATADHKYQVQFKDSLSDATWQNLGAPITPGSSQAALVDSAPGGRATRFYRVVELAE